MTYLDSLVDHIVANTLGVAGSTVYIGYMDDTGQTDPVSALAAQNGLTRETLGDGGTAIEMPVVQLSVRAPTFTAAWDRADAIRNLFKSIKNQTVQGTAFLRVAPSGTIRDLGRDGVGRQMFTCEFDVWMQS